MIDKRLIGIVPGSMRYVGASVALQWASLVANMGMVLAICRTLSALWAGTAGEKDLVLLAVCVVVAAVVRGLAAVGSARMGFLASREVKRTLRHRIYEKLLRLGPSYREDVRTSEVVQVAVEGCDQLETYFGAYLPQFFYAMLAPLTLFVALAFVNVPAAVVLLVCVPLIPVAIAAVQTWAKKQLGRYWGQSTELGDTFLENLQGLTTLKVYQADEFKQAEMNEQAEKFRRITMRVLTMQLNSITIMDLVAYGGAAAGVAVALTQMAAGAVDLGGCLAIILLAAVTFTMGSTMSSGSVLMPVDDYVQETGNTQIEEMIREKNQDLDEAVVLMYETESGDETETQYLIYTPLLSEDSDYSVNSGDGLFRDSVSIDIEEESGGGNALLYISCTSDKTVDLELTCEGSDISYEIEKAYDPLY